MRPFPTVGRVETPTPREAAPDTADTRRAELLARGFGGLVALVFCLIVLGALVRAHGAGLACPDWPLCFGELVPRFDFHVAFEWGHRLVAGTVSLVFVALSALALSRPATRTVTRPWIVLAGVLLAVQVVLGGLTVLHLLAAWTVTSHLLTGNAFAATLLVISLELREAGCGRIARPALPDAARLAVSIAAAVLVFQLALGGLVSSRYAGLACPDWPTCANGQWFPSFEGAYGLHLAHRTNAYLLVAALGAAAWCTRGAPRLARAARVAFGLGLLQTAIGVANVWLRIPVEITGLHTAAAAALVLLTAHLVRETFRAPREVRHAAVEGLARARG
jgi:cytochrome c oxidase assembly protein subunit 15